MCDITITLVSKALRRCSIDENCAANLLQADMQCVISCVESVLSCAILQKMKTLTSGGQKFMLLGADINLSATAWSAADRITKLTLRGQCGMVRFHPVLN